MLNKMHNTDGDARDGAPGRRRRGTRLDPTRTLTASRLCQSLFILLILMGVTAMGEDTNSPPMSAQDFFEGTSTNNNWVDFSAGSFLTHGDRAQAEAVQHWNNGGFGGIQDLHLQGNGPFTNTTVTLDGHSIYDQHNYDINARMQHADKWFLQFHANNFRTWSDDIGGYYPPTGTQYYGPKGSSPLALDRGEYSFLGGLTLAGFPSITFGYTHSYRYGNEDSTIWGPTHPNPSFPGTVQGLAPSIYNLDETVDAFDLNAKKNIWNTDLALGLHYEHGDLNDGLNTTFYPGEIGSQTDRTMADKNTYNLFSANATGEKWIKQHVFVSAGGMVANLDNNFSGSQIYGGGFGVPYFPALGNGFGYYNMTGDSHLQEYVMDLNLLAIPVSTFEITPAIRAEKEGWSANSAGTGTLGTYPTESFNSQSSRDVVDVCESLDARYTGFTNWVLSAGGRWEESDGNLNQFGGFSQVDGIGVPAVTNYVDDTSLLQKYSAGANWYPLRQLAVDFGGYYKHDEYNYSAPVNSTADGETYPGYFTIQDFQTFDGNCRVTLHLLQSLSLVSRYEYQVSLIDTTPSANPPFGTSEIQTSRMNSHVIGQNISWVPWSRLSLEAGFTYVLSTTKTPAAAESASVDSQLPTPTVASILKAENNYWTLNFSPSFILDDKTDLSLNYFYYQADDYQNNSAAGVPLGAGSREQAVTATLTRRINARLRVSLQYGYYDYNDALTAGNSNFRANLFMATIRYRF